MTGASRPQPAFANESLGSPQAGELPAEPEPDAVAAHAAWSIPPRPSWQDYLQRGTEAYQLAVGLEEAGRRAVPEGQDYELDEETVAAYKAASTNLLSVTAEIPTENGEWWGNKPVDPVRLLMLGTSLARQAAAPEVEEFGHDPLTAHPFAPRDRREHLHHLATEAFKRASNITFGEAKTAGWDADFDDGFRPDEVMAAAAVEAAIEAGTAAYAPVDDDTIERLKAEGYPAVSAFIERHASQRAGTEFLATMGQIAVEEMPTQTYSFSLELEA